MFITIMKVVNNMGISKVIEMEKEQISNIEFAIDAYHEEIVVLLKPLGKISKETILLVKPYLEEVLAESTDKSIRFLIDATEFSGWEHDAFLEDLKIALKHRKDIDKIAFCGHQHWQEIIVELANHLISTEVQFFESLPEAELWITL